MDQLHNPFEGIVKELTEIKSLLLDLKHPPSQGKQELANDLLTVDEAADLLDLSKATIYKKVHYNELPFMKRSKRLYFSRKELMAYLKEGSNRTNSQIAQSITQ